MTIPEILKELEPYTGKFPKAAMQAAVEQREAIIPELLRVVEAVADNPQEYAERDNYQVHLFALFLLAQFREKRAYPAIVKMVSAPGETPYDLLGETTSDGLDRILASVYDGNPALLQGLVESDKVDDFVRGSALNAFLVLAKTGEMPREEAVDYMRALFQERLPREFSHIWNALACAVADFPAPELLEEVRRAYADNLVDTEVADLEGIERDLADPGRVIKFRLITDAIAEMEWWAASESEDPSSAEAWPESPLPQPSIPAPQIDLTPPKPLVREPKIGRNEPCPCGSGKKYKRCCGK